MAKYTVVHNCEHEEHLELFGPLKDRAYRLVQLRQRPCRDCQRTSHEGDNAEARVGAMAGPNGSTVPGGNEAITEAVRVARDGRKGGQR